MRAIRALALASLVLAGPLSRGAAQTCQGMAAFQDGRIRLGLDDQGNSALNGVRETLEYGLPKSIYGGISVGGFHVSRPSSSSADLGLNFGYQIPISDTPFQFCPAASAHYSWWGGSRSHIQEAFGGALGYRLGISDWLAVVPAAGVWFIHTRTPSSGVIDAIDDPAPDPSAAGSDAGDGASNQVFLTMGLVFKKLFVINPGVIFPSQSGANPIYTLGVSMNWANRR